MPNLTKVQSLKDVDLGKLEITKKIERIKIASKSKYRISSENVTAFNYDSTKTDLEIAVQAHNNFMNSKPHKMNVLKEDGDYFDRGYILPSHYGHHVVYNERINAIIVVQMFPSLNY